MAKRKARKEMVALSFYCNRRVLEELREFKPAQRRSRSEFIREVIDDYVSDIERKRLVCIVATLVTPEQVERLAGIALTRALSSYIKSKTTAPKKKAP